MKQYLGKFDRAVTVRLYHHPAFLERVFGWITLLGHPIVVVLVAGLIALAAMGLDASAIALAFITGLVALALGSSLKFVLRRPRPETPYAARMLENTFSFPSGHAYGAGIVYGLTAQLAILLFADPWNIVASLMLFPLIILVGLSRIYLGAHYFLDVIGGWLLAIPVVVVISVYIL